MPEAPNPRLWRVLLCWILLLVALLGPAAVVRAAPDEFVSRVGRVVQVDGRAWMYDDEERRWTDALRNRVVTQGDRFATDPGAFLQLAVGSTELRMAGGSEIAVDRLADDRLRVRVVRGSLAVRVRNRDLVREIDWVAGDVKAWPERIGHYRIDRLPQAVGLTSWRGQMRVDTGDQRLSVDAGRRVELWREGRDGTAVTWGSVIPDAFSDLVVRDEARDDRLAAARPVYGELTGAEELDAHGRWERHPEYGMVWVPLGVAVDWAPFRQGRWYWHARWGWTWMDDAPWGFATSHYGRWASWGGRWCWVPGSSVGRPVFAPAVVAWPTLPPTRQAPPVHWTPLTPRDPFPPMAGRPPSGRPWEPEHAHLPRPGEPGHVPTPRVGEPGHVPTPRVGEPGRGSFRPQDPLPGVPTARGPAPAPGLVEPDRWTGGHPPRGERGTPSVDAPGRVAVAPPVGPAPVAVPPATVSPVTLPPVVTPPVSVPPVVMAPPAPVAAPNVPEVPRGAGRLPGGREGSRRGDPPVPGVPAAAVTPAVPAVPVVPTAPVAPVADRPMARGPEVARPVTPSRETRQEAPREAQAPAARHRGDGRGEGRGEGRERVERPQ